jgi:hypothetical protein
MLKRAGLMRPFERCDWKKLELADLGMDFAEVGLWAVCQSLLV